MRNQTIDIAKGIGILTVVICHNWLVYHDRGEVSNIIFSFHMPLFFFISGIFFKPNVSFKEIVTSKAAALLKPYATVMIVLIIFDFIRGVIKSQPFNFFHALLKDLYSSTFTLDWVQMWFLTHLFAICLFSWLLNKLFFKHIKNRGVYFFALMIIFLFGVQTIRYFWYYSFNPFGINTLLYENQPQLLGLPFNLDILLVTTPIFLAGYFFSKEMLNFKFNHFLFWFSLIIFIFLHYIFDFTIGLHQRQFDQWFVTSIQMVAGIYLVFGMSSIISQQDFISKILAYLGSASLFILIFHYSIQHWITGIFQYRFPEYPYPIATVAFVVSIIYSVMVYEVVNKSRFFKNLFYAKPNK